MLTAIPQLQATLFVGRDVLMSEEEYSMDLYLVIQESEAAMDKGNIYVSALIRSQ